MWYASWVFSCALSVNCFYGFKWNTFVIVHPCFLVPCLTLFLSALSIIFYVSLCFEWHFCMFFLVWSVLFMFFPVPYKSFFYIWSLHCLSFFMLPLLKFHNLFYCFHKWFIIWLYLIFHSFKYIKFFNHYTVKALSQF